MEVVHHNHIPIEMIRQILLKLEVKAVIRCECVYKEWRSIIQDPNFKLSYRGPNRVMAVAHYSSGSSIAVTSITNTTTPRIETLFVGDTATSTRFLPLSQWWSGVWCSCNGLVLFSAEKHILLWNPSTHCCTKVLELRSLLSPRYEEYVVSGLCYVPSTGDYKAVVCLHSDRASVLVASLENKEWWKVLFPYKVKSIKDGGVNFRNTLHWRVGDLQTGFNKIVYFEAESDEFKELPVPVLGGESNVILGMGIIDDCLCVALERKELIQVFVMKEYGVEKSWVSEFNISASYFGFEQLLCGYINITLYSSKCNAKVLICGNSYLLVYDLKNNTFQAAYFTESNYWGLTGICSYVQSIVSPHKFIWRDNDDQDNPPAQNDDALLSFILERFNITPQPKRVWLW